MSTYLSLHYHISFSTKGRRPLIHADVQARLHEYLGGIVHNLEAFPNGIGGVADHVHLLVSLRATHCLADFVRDLKKRSSAWMKDEVQVRDFAWQDGYCALTVSPSARPEVHRYIVNQSQHHASMGSKEELRKILVKAGVDFDERYFN